ncbi:hypothetical protein CDV31_016210 [Fusarium ambrosium]|uniref:Uncharacterized protein n=1 Tax=Fusarium ambrosium TaxID=131363 RepID=A0A428SD14_9HYPO|nr:hypothetical protein CDV31_016210 [Fusarium ambrosium]
MAITTSHGPTRFRTIFSPPNITQTCSAKPGMQICVAYEALFELDKKYHTSPPDLYALAEAKPVAEYASLQTKAEHAGRLMAALHKKTEKIYGDVKSLPDGSAKDRKRRLIRVWTKIALVLIKEDIREVYDAEIKGNIVKGLHKVCGQRWKKMKLD